MVHESRTRNLPRILGAILLFFLVQFMILSWYFGVNFQDIHGQIFRAQDEDAPSDHNEAFRRAVVVYFPNNRVEELLPQFLGLRRSWLELEALEPKQWRTDLVVYTNGPQVLSLLEEVGCKKIRRRSNDEPNRCVVVPTYEPLTGPSFSNAEGDLINIAAMPRMNAYHWIVRTDMHAFLMPAFALWKPSAMTVSHGTYTNSLAALTRVAQDFNMSDATLTNIGLTWYGPTRLIQSCATLAVKMIRLIANVPDLRNDILLHASHLAINQCTKGFGIKVRNDMLEFRATSLESPSKHAHVSVGPEDKPAFSEESMRRFANDAQGSLRQDVIHDYTVFMALDGLASHNATSTDKFANPIALIPKSTEPPRTTQKTSDSLDVPETEKSFVRAAVVFLPVGVEGNVFIPQLRWFLRSWQHIKLSEPTLWRTDVVVFTNGPVPELEDINCTVYNVRKTREEPNRCVLINTYKRLKSDEFDYDFGDSIGVAASDESAMDIYEWVLRTDMDTFLTPVFAKWKPKVMTVGGGGYSFSKTNEDRLTRIIKDMGLHNSKLNNIGSTWYGPAKLVRKCAKLTIDAMKYLHEKEFTALEKSKEYDTKGWPEWHYGVLTLYAGHIAINHCTRDAGAIKDDKMLDYSTASNGTIDGHAHLHTWQNDDRFSKYIFANGGYAHENKSALDLNVLTDYAVYMALDSIPAPKSYVNASFVRAAVVFIPTKNREDVFVKQFRWFRRSWEEMQKYEPAAWRTDIIVLTNGIVKDLWEFNCSSVYRQSREEPNKCIVIQDYKLLYTEEFKYRFGDSINVLTHDSAVFDQYDWLLRTDIDVFFTPTFSTWHPDKMVVGGGGYQTAKNRPRLDRIAQDMGLQNLGLQGVGSTWYGPTNLVRECAKLTVKAMKYLHEHEFTDEEKSPEYGTKGWPDWHYGVLTLYAGHIAINHCAYGEGAEKNEEMLDYPTSSDDATALHAHLHTWQGRERFSKFVFEDDGYADEKMEDLSLDKVSDYAMYMALDSQETPEPTPVPIEYDPSLKQGQVLLRAIVVFFPPGKDSISSLRLLHRSWKEMLRTEPKLWRTDLVVFTNGTNEEVGSLGCTSMYRTTREYKSFCVQIDNYELLSDVTDPLGNSVNILTKKNVKQMAVYKWILRTDVDTLITPAFAAWFPSNRMVSSWAPYSSGNAAPLARISTELELNKPIAHVGSVWYGEASLLQSCAKFTVEVLRHLENHEFTSADKSIGDWRAADRALYALAIAVGNCTSETGIEINATMFDISTTSSASPNVHAHLRTSVESGKKYNRLDFAAGAYADIKLDSLDRNVIHDYAMYMALKSHGGLIPTSSPPGENHQAASFVRAAVVFLPSGKLEAKFLREFRWFRRSWVEMLKYQPETWRTDLIVFTDGDGKSLLPFNCTVDVIRTSSEDSSRCIIVPGYKTIDRNKNEYALAYADSINVLTYDTSVLEPYDWILRTDLDTFLTPAFSNWAPKTMVIGFGQYSHSETNRARLDRIIKDLKWTNSGLSNVGSTLYGPTKLVRECAKLAMEAAKYINEHEFTAEEKSEAYGVKGWPEWHYGVLTLYAGDVAINHCTHGKGVEKNNEMLDYPTTSDHPPSEHAHLHTWQNHEVFSKYDFAAGKYANISLLSLSLDKIRDYAMYMALDSADRL
ncbi:unnamed protein product [Aphanomyces euteiches]